MPSNGAESKRVQMLRRAIVEDMDKRPALSRDGLLTQLEKMLGARRHVYATRDGLITDERVLDDNGTQLRATALVAALRNEFPAKQLDVDVAFQLEQLPDLSALPRRELMKLAGVSDEDIIDVEASPEPGSTEGGGTATGRPGSAEAAGGTTTGEILKDLLSDSEDPSS